MRQRARGPAGWGPVAWSVVPTVMVGWSSIRLIGAGAAIVDRSLESVDGFIDGDDRQGVEHAHGS